MSEISVPSSGHHRAGDHEQVSGAVHQEEAQVAPSVAEARQLRDAGARVVLDRELPDLEVLLGRPDHHLRGELHAGGAQVQPGEHVAADPAHAAVGVLDPGPVEEVEHPREHWVAHVAVQPRHRPGVDVVHPVAHHEVGALLELAHEARDLLEVVGEVGVHHHDVAAARGREAGEVGAAVPALLLAHHDRTRPLRQLGAAVIGAVVGHDHLAADAAGVEPGARQRHARLDVPRLVEAGDHDRDERLLLGGLRGGARKLGRLAGAHWRGRRPSNKAAALGKNTHPIRKARSAGHRSEHPGGLPAFFRATSRDS